MNTTQDRASTHGHALMEWLRDNGPLPREELLDQAARAFGPDCRFHTCSLEGLTAAALVDFLVAKGKFATEERGLYLAVEPCDH